jgi:hypothetical protein
MMPQQRQPNQAEASFSDEDTSSSVPSYNEKKLNALAIKCRKMYKARKTARTHVLTERNLSRFSHLGRTQCYMCEVSEKLHLRKEFDGQTYCTPCTAKWRAMALVYSTQPHSPTPVPTQGAMAAVHVGVPLPSARADEPESKGDYGGRKRKW